MAPNFFTLAEEACVTPKIMFIGGGNMAYAIINGCLSAGLLLYHSTTLVYSIAEEFCHIMSLGFLCHDAVAVTTRSHQSADKWKKDGFNNVGTCNVALLKEIGPSDQTSFLLQPKTSGVIVLSVKPHLRHNVYAQLKGSSDLAAVPLIISLMAGIRTDVLQKELAEIGYTGPVLRIMPNTPSSVREGATLLAVNSYVSPDLVNITKRLAESVGMVVEVDEGVYNAAAAVSGCGPAWVGGFYLETLEYLLGVHVHRGTRRWRGSRWLSPARSHETRCSNCHGNHLFRNFLDIHFQGAAKMVLESGEHPGALKDKVCSPGGTTIAGVRKLETSGFRGAVIEAVKAAADRADAM